MITSAHEAVATLRPAIPKKLMEKQECFVVIALDTKHVPIGKPLLIGIGTVNYVNVHPRDVFREAVHRNAHAVIVAHNHPSGDVSPSSDDVALTKRLQEAGVIIGISVLDHLILTKSTFCSMLEQGVITK